MVPGPTIFVCDCISWRLDHFEVVLQQIADAARVGDDLVEVTLGYRLRDDLAVVLVEPSLVAHLDLGELVRPVAEMPGMRVLPSFLDDLAPEELARKALSSCDLVVSARNGQGATARVRQLLGMGDDRRRSVRLAVDLPIRYNTPGGWMEARTRDLTSSGLFIETNNYKPEPGEDVEVEFFPEREHEAIRGVAVGARHTPDGFGAMLRLSTDGQAQLYDILRRSYSTVLANTRRSISRIPAHLDVALTFDDDIVLERTENLSAGGVFVRMKRWLPTGALVKLGLRLEGGSELQLSGSVARVVELPTSEGEVGCAISFGTMPADSRERLESYIEAFLSPPTARVLLAVEADTLRTALSEALKRLDCEVVTVSGGTTLFERLVEELLYLNLLVIDAELPSPSARELLHRIRKLGGETELPIVLLAAAVDEARQAFDGEGATEVLGRDVPTPVLAEALMKLARELRSKKV